MTPAQLEKIDMNIAEATCLLEIVTYIAEADEEDRKRLRPSAITLLYVTRDMLRSAVRVLGNRPASGI